jgi:hypothetical protein
MLLRFVVVLSLSVLAWANAARADQRRDFMLEGDQVGNRLLLDYFGTGGQLTLEHRGSIYGSANSYSANVATLLGYPLGQVTTSLSLRVLFLEFGVMAGYRAVWRNLSFEPGADGNYCANCDRAARRHQDPVLASGPDTDRYGLAEARVQLYAPFNDSFVLTSLLAADYQGLRPRSYDWFYTDVHDPGVITRWETLAFFKHPKWGGIGPYFQLLVLPRAGHHESEFAYGFNAVTRLGLIDRNDLVFLTFLIRPTDPYYGEHSYFAPVRALIIYRLMLSL